MKKIEELYNYADNQNIKIKNFTDNEKKINGICLYDNKICNIYINTAIESEVEEKCVLAEEIGHYETGIIKTKLNYTDHQNCLIRSINEFKAKKWAVSKLIPFNDFKRFLGTNCSKFEIAEELDVTEDLINMACFIYEPLVYELGDDK